MGKYVLKAQTRTDVGKKSALVREKGYIPAVLYGSGISSQNLMIKKSDFLKVYGITGSSKLIDLQVEEGKPTVILIHDLQTDPLTDEIIHVDLYQIKEGQEITAEVKLVYKGESPAVKELGGILVKNYDEIEIKCLPKDLELIDVITVDLSGLKEFNDAIHIKDLKVPAEIKITEDPENVVVQVSEPKEEKIEEVKAPEAEGAAVPAEGEKQGEQESGAGEKESAGAEGKKEENSSEK